MPASTSTGEWVVARVGGAPVVISPTSLLLGLLIAGSWYPLVSSALGAFGTTTVLLVVVSTVLGVAASVLLHELAHGLSGTLMGRRPTRYELYLWGGRTSFGPAREWTAWKDLVTSLSGPATNLLLWLIGTVVQDFVSLSVPVAFTIWAVTLVNLALAVFNALPGLPLDGGYALAALVVQVTGNRRLGLKVAGWGGLAALQQKRAQNPPPHDGADHDESSPAGRFEAEPAIAGHLDDERGQGVAAIEGKPRQSVENGQGQVDQRHCPHGEGHGNREARGVLHQRPDEPDEQVGGRAGQGGGQILPRGPLACRPERGTASPQVELVAGGAPSHEGAGQPVGQLVQEDRAGDTQDRGDHDGQHGRGSEYPEGGGDQRVPASGNEQSEQEGGRRDDDGSATDTGDHPFAGR